MRGRRAPDWTNRIRSLRAPSALAVQVIDPAYRLGPLHRLYFEVVHQAGLPAARQNTVKLQVLAGIDLLVRYIGRHVNEITGPGLGDEFEPISPAQACDAAHNIDHALQVAVMMRAGLGPGIDGHRAGPELRRARAIGRHRRATLHAKGLRGIGIEFARRDDPHALEPPLADWIAHGDLRSRLIAAV